MRSNLLGVRPTPTEVLATAPGDEIVDQPDVVMDRAFDLPAPPAAVWPWINQLGKDRAGWYLPRWVERFVPARRRALGRIDESLQQLQPGDVIPDWGGKNAIFKIVTHQAPNLLVHRSTRANTQLSWAIMLQPSPGGTRMHLRLRMAGIKHRRTAEIGGGLVDLLTVAGLAAGLRERIAAAKNAD
ncbi:MAG: hypothetical protein ACR2P2_01850 [Nakamurella sp.]